MFGLLIKILIPIGAAYLISKVVRDFLDGKKQVKNRYSNGDVIDVCPRCGELEKPDHHC